MSKKAGLVVVFSLGLGVASLAAQKAPDFAELAPESYRLVLDNVYVRVAEVRAGAGQKFPLHSHPPHLTVVLAGARVKLTTPDGKATVADIRPGETSWSDGGEHAAEILVGTAYEIQVELKGTLPSGTAVKAPDSTQASPDTHRVVLDNPRVRVVEVRIPAGHKVPMHSHPARVAVVLAPARLKHTYPDGKSSVGDLRPGEARWAEAEEHSGEVLVGPLHIILAEPKGTKAATPFQPGEARS